MISAPSRPASHDRLVLLIWGEASLKWLDESVSGSGVYPTPDVLDGYLGRLGLFRNPDTRGFRLKVGYRSWQNAVTPVNMSVFGAVVDPATLRTTSRTGGSQNPYARLYRPEKNFADANWNLIVSFAERGCTVGDPSASEGERFAAGLSAFGRLFLVGSEWGSYAAPVSGSGGRAAGVGSRRTPCAARSSHVLRCE